MVEVPTPPHSHCLLCYFACLMLWYCFRLELDSHFSVATVAVVNCLSSEIVDLDSHRDCMNWSRLLKCFMHNLTKKST